MAQDEDIGARVRAARSFADLSQQGLADAIGVERRIVGYIEANEERHELTIKEAQAIANATGTPIDFLLHGWDAAPNGLTERIAALEARVNSADEDREDLVERLSAHVAAQETRFAELVKSIDTQLAEFAKQVLMRRRTQRRREDPPAKADPPIQ